MNQNLNQNSDEVAASSIGGIESTPTKDVIIAISDQIINLRTAFKKAKNTQRNYVIIIALLIFPLVLNYQDLIHVNLALQIILWIFAILLLIATLGTDVVTSQSEIERLEIRKTLLQPIFDVTEQTTYFDSLVSINIQNLGDYYSLVKTHTEKSFALASRTSTVGFILIVVGLAVSYVEPTQFQGISYLVSGAGIIIEIISSLFFYLYNKTVRQLKEYHDSLLDVQNILLSFKLIETTKTETDKTTMMTTMIEFLIGKNKSSSI